MANSTGQTELTVILLTFNREDLVEETLASLAEQEWDGDWEIVLLDNQSTDSTPQILARWAEKMPVPTRIVVADEGKGVPYVRNAGARASDARSILYLDDDDIILPGFVPAMAEALRDHEFVGPRHDYHHLNDERTARDRGGQTEALTIVDGVPVVAGGGFGCRRDLWTRLDGNDENFGTGQDIDFSMRVAALGDVTPHFCEDAVYCVRVRTASTSSFTQGRRMGRAIVHVHKRHTSDVRPTPGATRRWRRRWLALALRVRTLRQPENRPRWGFDLGHEVGRLGGMLEFRTWYP